MGDGGSGGDPENRAQNPDQRLGKLLRLDSDGQGARRGRGPRPAQPLALLLRPQDRRPLHRRRRPGRRSRRSTRPAAGPTALLNFGWRRLRGSIRFDTSARPRRARPMPIAAVHARRRLQRDRRLRLSRQGRPCAPQAATSTATTAAARSGASRSATDGSPPRRSRSRSRSLSSFGEEAAGELYLSRSTAASTGSVMRPTPGGRPSYDARRRTRGPARGRRMPVR